MTNMPIKSGSLHKGNPSRISDTICLRENLMALGIIRGRRCSPGYGDGSAIQLEDWGEYKISSGRFQGGSGWTITPNFLRPEK